MKRICYSVEAHTDFCTLGADMSAEDLTMLAETVGGTFAFEKATREGKTKVDPPFVDFEYDRVEDDGGHDVTEDAKKAKDVFMSSEHGCPP